MTSRYLASVFISVNVADSAPCSSRKVEYSDAGQCGRVPVPWPSGLLITALLTHGALPAPELSSTSKPAIWRYSRNFKSTFCVCRELSVAGRGLCYPRSPKARATRQKPFWSLGRFSGPLRRIMSMSRRLLLGRGSIVREGLMISYHCYERGDLPIHQIGPIVLNVVIAAFGDDASALAGQALCLFLPLTPCYGVGF